MSLFSWFSNKSTPERNLSTPGAVKTALPVKIVAAPHLSVAALANRPVGDEAAARPPSVERKLKRHARREQLYVAIRESMTRAGMLSASYKFKVLSLDQNGNQFLVMMDIAAGLTTSAAKLTHTEEILMQTAKAGYDIVVTAVYWRVDAKASLKAPMPVMVAAQEAPETDVQNPSQVPQEDDSFVTTQANAVWTPEMSRHDPLLEAEVAAFRRALAAASPAGKPAGAADAVMTAASAPNNSKSRGNAVTSYALITGFEDTERSDSNAVPALSTTQYGDLN